MPTILRELETQGVRAQIMVNEWAARESGCSDEHKVMLYTAPYHRGRARFLDAPSKQFVPLTPLFYCPAGFAMEGESDGGQTRALRCSLSRSRFAQVAGSDFSWRPEEVSRGLRLDNSSVMPLMVRLANEVKNPGFANDMVLDSLANMLIIELIRNMRGVVEEDRIQGLLTKDQLEQLRQRIEAIDLPAPRVSELADLCGLGERHVLRRFKNTTGRTLSERIKDAQRTRALRLLSETDLPLKEVAYRLGFAAHSGFSTAFKKATGESPYSYRRRSQQ